MTQTKILITGSQGIIGKILTRNLSDDFDIYGLDIKDGEDNRYFKADVSRYDELDSLFNEIGSVDCIIHLAGDPQPDAAWESVLKNNITGTRNIYECARQHSVKKVIFASSNLVTSGYIGFPQPVKKEAGMSKITVCQPIRPDSDYGSSKAFGESVARQYFELYGIQSICLRIGWVIENDDPTIDKVAPNVWLSHRDLLHLIRRSILSDIPFGIYYGVSNNRVNFWDISNAKRELGYRPEDDAYSLIHEPVSLMAIVKRIRKKCMYYLGRKTIAP